MNKDIIEKCRETLNDGTRQKAEIDTLIKEIEWGTERLMDVFTNKEVCKNRTIKEQLRLANSYKWSDFDKEVLKLITDKELLTKRDNNSHALLIWLFITCGSNKLVSNLILDKNIINKYDTNSQYMLIRTLIECNFKVPVYEIAKNKEYIENLTLQEHQKLMYEKSKEIDKLEEEKEKEKEKEKEVEESK